MSTVWLPRAMINIHVIQLFVYHVNKFTHNIQDQAIIINRPVHFEVTFLEMLESPESVTGNLK